MNIRLAQREIGRALIGQGQAIISEYASIL